MAVWYTSRTMRWSTKAVIAAGLLAVLLVAAVPVALFGASILAAAAAVVIASLSGVRHLRKLVTQRDYRVVQLRPGEYHYE